MDNKITLKILGSNIDINHQVREMEPKTVQTAAKITNEEITPFEKELVMGSINKSKFADELLLNSAPVFLNDHFKSKRLALFRAMMPMTMATAQITPEFLADQKFMSSVFDGTFVEVISDSDQARPNKRTVRFKITCANWLILNLNAELSEFKPDDVRDIGRLLGGGYKQVRGFMAEKTGKEQSKNMPIFKLKKYLLLREDGVLDMFVICVLNNTMLLKTAEVFISKFLDKAQGNLAKQVAERVNSPLEGFLQVCKLKDKESQEEIRKVSIERNKADGISGFLAICEADLIQYMEGSRDQVNSLKRRIEQDKRQTDFIKILQGSLEKRLYPGGFESKLVTKDEYQGTQKKTQELLLETMDTRNIE